MKRQQLFVISGALAILVLLFIFGQTTPSKGKQLSTVQRKASTSRAIQFNDILAKAKQRISSEQVQRLASLENSVIRGDVKEQKIRMYKQLASFWKDSAGIFEPYAYYTAEASKLENSEKSLTFAAQLFVDNLPIEGAPAMQHWLAINAKDLLDKALQLNPNNDSTKIGIGACYMFGDLSDNPMEGILKVREIAQKDPNNIYAQMILGLGGKKSGQYDKAIERFSNIIQKDPRNLGAIFQMGECYELKGDKLNAIKWYETGKSLINNPGIQKQIEKRIKELK